MSKTKKIYFSITILVILLSVYLIFTIRLSQLTKPLEGMVIKNIKVSGDSQTFRIINGSIYIRNNTRITAFKNPFLYKEIATIGNFYKANKEDPLFASPEMNSKKFRVSLKNLISVQDKILEKVKLKDNFVPTSFLTSLVQTKIIQEKFTNKPSLPNAKRLLKSYKNNLKSYKENINSIRKYIKKYDDFESENNPDNRQTFLMIGSKITFKSVLADLDLMLDNAKALAKEISFRESLLNGNSYKIKTPVIKPKKSIPNSLSALSRDELFIPKRVKIKGPYKVITTNFVGKATEQQFYIYVHNSNSNFAAKLATDNFLSFLPSNNRYKWQIIGDNNNYNTNDLEYKPKLLTLDAFIANNKEMVDKIKGADYYKNLAENEKNFIEKAQKAEKVFFSMKIPSENKLNNLGAYYFKIYSLLLKNKNHPKMLEQHKEELLRRYLLINNKQSNLDLILTNTKFQLKSYWEKVAKRIPADRIIKPDDFGRYLYVSRSGYSFAFFNFSKAIWRLNKKPKYSKPIISSDKKIWVTYRELLKRYKKEFILSHVMRK